MFNAINPNVRSAVAFSAKRDVMRNGQQPANSASSPANHQPRFGALPLYHGPYNNIHVITDFQDQASNARIQQRFQDVQKFVAQHRPAEHSIIEQDKHTTEGSKSLNNFSWDQSTRWKKDSSKGILGQTSIADVPLRNIDAASQTLFELAHAPNQDIFVHVTDPGVGSGQEAHKRSILVSDHHGIHVGPNNGSLGLLAKFLQQKKDPYKVMEIDLDRISQLESRRTGVPKTDNGSTFHGRDVFGVAAAAIAGGLDPETLSKGKTIQPVYSAFAQGAKLPTRKGEKVTVHANRDNTSGNLVLNLAMTPEEFKSLLDEKAQFQLKTQNSDQGKNKFQLAFKKDHKLNLPAKRTFGEVKQGEPLFYLGSKNAVKPGQRYIEVAVNCGDISDVLKLRKQEKAYELSLTRL